MTFLSGWRNCCLLTAGKALLCCRRGAWTGWWLLSSLLLFSIAGGVALSAQETYPEKPYPKGVDSEDFYQIYDYETPVRGGLEASIWMTYIPKSRADYGAFYSTWDRARLTAYTAEMETGITDRLCMSTYIDFINAHGEMGGPGTGMRFTQARFEGRYRFSQPKAHLFDTAAYLEYHVPAKSYADSQELEMRVILERNFKNMRLDLNPSLSVFTTGSDQGKAPSANFNTGIYYQRFATVQPGLEYYSGFGTVNNVPPLRKQQHLLFTTADFKMHEGWTWHVGVGYGLTHHSDQLTVQTILTYEFNGLHGSRLFRGGQKRVGE